MLTDDDDDDDGDDDDDDGHANCLHRIYLLLNDVELVANLRCNSFQSLGFSSPNKTRNKKVFETRPNSITCQCNCAVLFGNVKSNIYLLLLGIAYVIH
ncbi:hypothetical protein BLOT_014046 [Blomia tropicalis]|nr:hypothetical protein BLOT_014046 [Blomia tropicalis]